MLAAPVLQLAWRQVREAPGSAWSSKATLTWVGRDLSPDTLSYL